MKKATIIRPLDKLGRIVIPKGIRDSLNMSPQSYCEIIPMEDGIFIRKAEKNLKKELEALINQYYSDGRYVKQMDRLIELQDEME
jgi:AbrB family looped-hinge helix DNA binding protein